MDGPQGERARREAPLKWRAIAGEWDKFLGELEAQLVDKKVELDVTDGALGWLADHGFDPKMGARPMARLIEDRIKRPLAEAILFGALAKGGAAVVDVAPGGGREGLALRYEPKRLSGARTPV